MSNTSTGFLRGAAKVLALIGRNHPCCKDAVAYVLGLAGKGDLYADEKDEDRWHELRLADAVALVDAGGAIEFPATEELSGVDGIFDYLHKLEHRNLGNAASVRAPLKQRAKEEGMAADSPSPVAEEPDGD